MLTVTTGCSAAELARTITEQFTPRIHRHLLADHLLAGVPLDLDRLSSSCPQRVPRNLPSLTAAVCTRNGSARIAECLEALTRLRYPAGALDILVIDNAPIDDATERVVRGYPSVRYIIEPRAGLNWARNRAVLEARGDVVAFTDDDASVDEWWGDAIARMFASEPDADAVTGLVVPDEIDVDAQRLFERYGGFGRGCDRRYYRVDSVVGEHTARRHGGSGKFGTGANMAFRRSFFDRGGLFDPALDVGTATNGGGDLDMFFRALKHGGMLVYEPAAIVRHRHRRTYGELRTQITNNGIGFYSYLVRTAREYPEERSSVVRLGAWWLWWWNLRRLARPAGVPRDLVVAELLGSLAGLRRYPRAKAQAASVLRTLGPQTPHASTANGA